MIPRAHWLSADHPPGSPGSKIYTSKRTGVGVWSPKSLAYDAGTDPPTNPAGFNPATMGIEAFSAARIPDPNDDPGLILNLDDTSVVLGLSVYSLINNTIPPQVMEVDVAMFLKDYFSICQGAFWSTGAWWSIQIVDIFAAPTTLRVYRSPDRVTWTAQDVANEPKPWFGSNSVCWDGDDLSDDKIHCIYADAALSLNWSLVEFDMATGTWGAPHDPVALVYNVFLPRVHQMVFSAATGDVFILYHNSHFGFPPNIDLGVKYAFLVAGVWTTDIFIDPNQPAGPSASQLLLDPNDTTVHYIFIPSSFGGPETPGQYVRIDLGGALSNAANFMLFNGVAWSAGYAYFCGHSIIDAATGSIIIPYAEPINPAVDSSRRPSVFVGTPLAAPVWTSENIDPDPMVAGPALFVGFGAEPPAPAPVAPAMQGGSRRMHVLVPNAYDACLHQDLSLYRRYRPRKACCEVSLYYDLTWVRAPKSAQPFRKTNAIPTPLAASGDVVVLDFQVPQGYDGLIAGLFNVYTGPGFLEGNGDIQWRLLINKVYAIHLGLVLVTLGSQAQSYPVLGGIEVQSGTHIQYIVNVPNLSGGILPLNSQIVCGLEGLFYARQ